MKPNTASLSRTAKYLIDVLDDYRKRRWIEHDVDPVLFALFHVRFRKVKHEHTIAETKSKARALGKRVDFRLGGPNPVLVELAVRPDAGGEHLYGPQNITELRKLSLVPQPKAKLRVLLLLDLSDGSPLSWSSLHRSYSTVKRNSGFGPSAVRVVYVHRRSRFNFLWQPPR